MWIDFEQAMALVQTFDADRCIAIEDSLNRTTGNFDRHVEIGKLICEGLEEKLSAVKKAEEELL